MSQEKGSVAVEGDKEDRISALPREIIDHILVHLPAQDAARTSTLSKKWRFVWSMLPYIMLNHHFFNYVTKKSQSSFIQIVDGILSLHRGNIVRFVLDAPKDLLLSHTDVDRWILHLTRDGVKELLLYMPTENDGIYQLPSYVFDHTTLTCLDLDNCFFKPPNSFLGFPKLKTLYLERITVAPTTEFCVLNVHSLVYLDVRRCDGTQYLHIVSPLLEELVVVDFHYLMLNFFMNCTKLRLLYVSDIKMDVNLKQDVRSNLEKLLLSLAPTLEKLYLVLFIPELFSVDRIPKGPLIMFNCLRFLLLPVNFGELNATSGALQLIKSIPNLSELQIFIYPQVRNVADAVLQYLNTPACLDQPLNKLKHVNICWFQWSKIELSFIKLLLAHSSSLVTMNIKPMVILQDPSKERNLTMELISFPKASSEAELKVIPIKIKI